jgi:hypothetical protein
VNGERAAKHRRTGGQQTAAVKLEQLRWRPHRGDRAFLVKLPPALGADIGAQDELIPMHSHILEPQNLAAHRLGAHPLGQRNADGLRLAVGMVRADTDKEALFKAIDHALDLAARLIAQRLDGVVVCEQ